MREGILLPWSLRMTLPHVCAPTSPRHGGLKRIQLCLQAWCTKPHPLSCLVESQFYFWRGLCRTTSFTQPVWGNGWTRSLRTTWDLWVVLQHWTNQIWTKWKGLLIHLISNVFSTNKSGMWSHLLALVWVAIEPAPPTPGWVIRRD